MLFSSGISAYPSTSTSLAMLWTFAMPLRILLNISWKTSATVSLNGSCSHLNLHPGVLNVVIRLLSLSSMTHQYPDLVSSRVKNLETGRSSRMSSIVLLHHWFCLVFLLRSFGSRHNLREPSGFFTGTIEFTH